MEILYINDIYQETYSSIQKFIEAAERMGIEIGHTDGRRFIKEGDYIQMLLQRLTTTKHHDTRDKIKAVITAYLNKYKASAQELAELKAKPEKVLRWYHTTTDRMTDFIETWSNFAVSPAVIFLTLLAALTFQIHHLAAVINRISETDGVIHGYVFATVAELTALMLTVHARKKWYLLVFAVMQFWVNVLYYVELPPIVGKLTLSVLIAFVIYSYSEIYTNSKIQ